MGRVTKSGRLRDRALVDVMHSKQATFDSLPARSNSVPAKVVEPEQKKQITIIELARIVREDELVLKVGFRLLPSKISFSKVWLELFFEGQKLSSVCISIPQGPLATDEFELTPVLDMRGIGAGSYAVRVEMFERWASGEVLTSASKEVRLEYVPVSRQERLIKIPTVKNVAGATVTVVLDDEKDIYRDMEQDMKKELSSKRDQW